MLCCLCVRVCVMILCSFSFKYFDGIYQIRISFVDDSGKAKTVSVSPFRNTTAGNFDDNDLFMNPESIVTIMVESPKEPPNSDFNTSFSSSTPAPPNASEGLVTSTDDSTVQCVSDVAASDIIVDDVQIPIDVNTPRDTSNIFYAYDESDVNATVSDPQSIIEQARVDVSHQSTGNVSQVNNETGTPNTSDQTASDESKRSSS